MRLLGDFARARLASRQREDGFAMLSAVLFMIIMAGMCTVLLSVVLGQTVPAYFAQKSTQTINAAQSGLQAAMGLIHLATDDNKTGDTTELPCTFTGNVNGSTATDGLSYTVQMSYFQLDPTGHDTDTNWINTNRLPCSLNNGVDKNTVPNYALIVSTGTGSKIPGVSTATTGNRVLQALYTFNVSKVNIPGGRIFDFAGAYCLEASAATAGSTVRFLAAASCTNDTKELWVYDTDYELKLASTVTGNPPGLCITGPSAAGGATQNATLQTCRSNSQRWNQLWSWQGQYSWSGQNTDIVSGPSSYCLGTGLADGSNLTGKLLQVISGGCSGAFAPAAAVGPGAASYSTHQIVNYQEFGRCVDVTNEDLTSSFMISFPCKQDATGTGNFLLWNHKWFYTEPPTVTAPQQIYVNYLDNTAARYCLTTPSQAADPAYVTFVACTASSNPAAQQAWTRVGADKSGYGASYVFKDTYGRCLGVDPTDTYNTWSKLVVASCDTSLGQKWNSPAGGSAFGISGYKETAP